MESPKPLSPAEIVCSPSQNSELSLSSFSVAVLFGRLFSLPYTFFPSCFFRSLFIEWVNNTRSVHCRMLLNLKYKPSTPPLTPYLYIALLSQLINVIGHVWFERIPHPHFSLHHLLRSYVWVLRFDRLPWSKKRESKGNCHKNRSQECACFLYYLTYYFLFVSFIK